MITIISTKKYKELLESVDILRNEHVSLLREINSLKNTIHKLKYKNYDE